VIAVTTEAKSVADIAGPAGRPADGSADGLAGGSADGAVGERGGPVTPIFYLRP
jgi:hypothetical protein